MMHNLRFSIESNNELSLNSFLLIRKLYMPIIGHKSTVLYELLADLSIDNYMDNYYVNNICKQIQIEENELSELFKNLEAVGLVDRFVKNDESHWILVLNLPLPLDKFNKNTLLKKHLIKKIGIQAYENIFHKGRKSTNNKVGYYDATKKYQDVFVQDFESHFDQNNNFYSTLDLVVSGYETHDENIKKLPSSHFIKYLFKRNTTFDENAMIGHLLKLGYNDATINLFIDFCVNQNNKIVRNYITKVAESFVSRSLMAFDEVFHELSVILNNKKTKTNKEMLKTIFNMEVPSNERKVFNNNLIAQSNNSKISSIDEIFSDEELKEMF